MKFLRPVSLLALGAAAMYLLDPRLGHRRRAMLRDRLKSGFKNGLRETQKYGRDLSYRARGLFHRVGDQIQSGRQDIPDSVLEARIRSKIGRYLDHHPHTFDLVVNHGNVFIRGQISDALYQRIQPVIREMPGVCSIKRVAPPPIVPSEKISA
ncbi:MAG: hypothetical protein KGQ59_04710 [Bdellovibrionales bacterium]|nr:hypothetical protein [Bdellovibrionales bacterium]